MPLVVLLFIVLPIAELYVIIQVGGAIGVLPTLALVVAGGVVGVSLVRSQGRAAWQRFNLALAEGRVPGGEVFDGAMIILGGALLLTPGFITDAFGLWLLIPPTRALLRRGVAGMAKRRIAFGWRVAYRGYDRHRGRRAADPFARPGEEPFARGAPGDGRPPPARGSYEVEGTAREVTEPHGELPGQSDRE